MVFRTVWVRVLVRFEYGGEQYNTVKYRKVRYSTVQYDTIRLSSLRARFGDQFGGRTVFDNSKESNLNQIKICLKQDSAHLYQQHFKTPYL